MQKRIFRIVSITLAVFALCFGFLSFYMIEKILTEEAKNEIKSVARTITTQTLSAEEIYTVLSQELIFDIRVTYIDTEGKVTYDSEITEITENHYGRPEVIDAVAEGFGESDRLSETTGEMTYYYALQYGDGIIRFSRESGSILSIFIGVIPILLFAAGSIIIISVIASIFISQRVTTPLIKLVKRFDIIEDEKGKGVSLDTDYEELQPLIEQVSEMRFRILDYIEELKKTEVIRREFSSNVSHELKTPLTTIKGFGEMLQNGLITDPSEVKKCGGTIYRESTRLLSLINEIMYLSALEENNAEEINRVNLLHSAKDAKKILAEKAKTMNIEIEIFGENLEAEANQLYISELFINLLENAIKYNRQNGWIKIKICRKGDYAEILISDNGIGIEEKDQKRIFERFYRADKSHSKRISGTGLGLSIVKHIVNYHKGSISLSSKVNKGTEFKVLIPLKSEVLLSETAQ